MSKAERFEKAFRKFQKIGMDIDEEYVFPETEDFMKLFYEFYVATKQGSGITWGQVEQIINKVVKYG